MLEGLSEGDAKWYIFMSMDTDELDPTISHAEENVPVGIARLRREWRNAGLPEHVVPQEPESVQPVLFPEVDGGAGVGDYTITRESARDSLVLSVEAVDRLIDSGELDSILVQGPDGVARRLISESSLLRFQDDSAIDPAALKRVAKNMADRTLAESVDHLREELEDLRNNQGKILQQMKDIILLEIRNLKEQDRDLTSFVYELAEEIKQALPKKKHK